MAVLKIRQLGEPHAVVGYRLISTETYVHIGSCALTRTVQPPNLLAWERCVGVQDSQIEVDFIELHCCPARARLRAMELIGEYQPQTNFHGRYGIPPAIEMGLTKAGLPCTCGAPDCYGAEVQEQILQDARSRRFSGGA